MSTTGIKVQQNLESGELVVDDTPRQEYRLNLNDVESSLEAVPEDSALLKDTMQKTEPCSAANSVYFHIPDSNVSDVATSECSLATNTTNTDFLSQLTKTEALSARQQVALWLTRTSMSDLSSMPSLKNLVQQQPCPKQKQNYYQQHRFAQNAKRHQDTTPTRPSSLASNEKASKKRKKLIQRNYSTKSLMGGFSFSFGSRTPVRGSDKNSNDIEEHSSPIRKCETVMALSGLTSNNSSVINLKNKYHSNYPMSQRQSRKSSMSLFKKLSRGARKSSAANCGTNTPHLTSGLPSECESPYPVRTVVTILYT